MTLNLSFCQRNLTSSWNYLIFWLRLQFYYKSNDNDGIREKRGAPRVVKEIKQYQEKWLQHVQEMDTNRIPKQALRY